MNPVSCYRCNKRRHVLLASAAGYVCYACVDVLKRLDETQEESPKCCSVCRQPMPLDGRQWVHQVQHAPPFLLCSEACFKRCRAELLANPVLRDRRELVPIESGEGVVLPEQPGDRERFLGMTRVDMDEAAMRDPIIGKRVREAAARRADRQLLLEDQPVTEPGDAVFNEVERVVLGAPEEQRRRAKILADESYALQAAILAGPQLMTPKDCLVSMIGLTEENADKVLAGTARWAEDDTPVVLPIVCSDFYHPKNDAPWPAVTPA